ncbi:hypothetical protein IAU59_001580 [Kwoniella sp. CBS 9459]
MGSRARSGIPGVSRRGSSSQQLKAERGSNEHPVRIRRRSTPQSQPRARSESTRHTRPARVHPFETLERQVLVFKSDRVLQPVLANARNSLDRRQDTSALDNDLSDESSSETSDSDLSSDGEIDDEADATSPEGQGGLDLSLSGQVSTISSETRTIDFDAGQSIPTASVLSDPTGGQGELKLAMMWETVNEIDTDIGKMTEKCLIPFDDPSQKFCETSLNGAVLGGGVGIDGSSMGVPESVVTETATASATTATPNDNATPSVESTKIDASPSTSDITSAEAIPPTTLSSSPPSTTSATSLSPLSSLPSSSETLPPINATISDIAAPTPTETPISAASVSNTIANSSNTSSSSIDPSSATAAAAASASEEAATVEIPGQKLQVLPIGLGIFGGVAGIAILVILYVTYQRRKYKKQFRDRTNALAEKVNRFSAGGGGA